MGDALVQDETLVEEGTPAEEGAEAVEDEPTSKEQRFIVPSVNIASVLRPTTSDPYRPLPSPNQWRPDFLQKRAKLPGSDPRLTSTQLFHRATRAKPKKEDQLLRDVGARRRGCSPKFSVQKQQNNLLLGSTQTLDTLGFVRDYTTNPLVGPERTSKERVPRTEPHYWQTQKVLMSTTGLVATRHAEYGTTRW